MAEEKREKSMNLIADADKRAGIFSDYMIAKNVNGKTILDFFVIDDMSEGEGVTATLGARVIMTYQGLLSLRDMLNSHIEATGLKEP